MRSRRYSCLGCVLMVLRGLGIIVSAFDPINMMMGKRMEPGWDKGSFERGSDDGIRDEWNVWLAPFLRHHESKLSTLGKSLS